MQSLHGHALCQDPIECGQTKTKEAQDCHGMNEMRNVVFKLIHIVTVNVGCKIGRYLHKNDIEWEVSVHV